MTTPNFHRDNTHLYRYAKTKNLSIRIFGSLYNHLVDDKLFEQIVPKRKIDMSDFMWNVFRKRNRDPRSV